MMMNIWVDVITSLIAGIALIISIKTWKFTKNIKQVVLEKDLLDRVNDARKGFVDFSIKAIELLKSDEDSKDKLAVFSNIKMEEYLNALEYASDKYNHGIVNSDSFKRSFRNLVIQVHENSAINLLISSDTNNKYPELKKALLQMHNKRGKS